MAEQPQIQGQGNLGKKLAAVAVIILVFFGIVLYKKSVPSQDSGVMSSKGTEMSNEGTMNSDTYSEEAVVSQPVEIADPAPAPEMQIPVATIPPVTEVAFKDGTYSASGTYSSPGGQEKVDVTITLSKGVVTVATVTPNATSPASKKFQGEFVENFKQYVVGKNISSLKLSKVAGSSLTSIGFNAAIEQIKAKAKS